MNPALKKTVTGLSYVVYLAVCGEIMIRILSSFILIYDVEMLNYAKQIKMKSTVPGLLHQHRPNVRARLMGVDFETNDLGHRSRRVATGKPAGEKRIYFMGTSITMGWGVPMADSFASVVERRLNGEGAAVTGKRYVAMNAGVANYNTVFALRLLRAQIDAVQPDLIVLQYFLRDAAPDPTGTDPAIFKYSVFAAFVYQNVRAFFASAAVVSPGQSYLDLHRDGNPSWEAAKRAVRELKALADERRIGVVVVLIPDPHDLSLDGPFPALYARLTRVFGEIGVPMVNPFPALYEAFHDKPRTAWVHPSDPHPNARAHKIIGEALSRHLARTGF